MRRHLQQYWRALHAYLLKLSPGSALVLLSAAGTSLAVLLWLEVSLTAAAITYAVTLGALLIILRRHARIEANAAKHAHGSIGNDNKSAAHRPGKKIVSSR